MSRRSGIVDFNQFDFKNFPEELTSAPARHDSNAIDAQFEKKEVRFGGVTTNSVPEHPEEGSEGPSFQFGGHGLSHKGSIARFFNSREEEAQSDALPTRQIKRKRPFSNLNRSDVAIPIETTHSQPPSPPEDAPVKSLRKTFSKVALRLGGGKRNHEEAAEEEELQPLLSRPNKRNCLPSIDLSASRWSKCVEKAFDVIADDIEVDRQSEDFMFQQQRNPNICAEQLRAAEHAIPPPIPSRSARRPFPYTQGARPIEMEQASPPPLPARSPLRPFPYTQGARPLQSKRVDHTTLTLAMFEDRLSPAPTPLNFYQLEAMRQFAEGNIHPALRQPPPLPDPLRCHPPAVVADSGCGSRETSADEDFLETMALLDQAIDEQKDMMEINDDSGEEEEAAGYCECVWELG